MYFPKPSVNENDLAIIEREDTAAHAIEAGQYVSWRGRTGKANTAIAVGDTLDDSLFDYDEDGMLNKLNNNITMPDYSNVLEEVPYTTNASYTYTATENCIFFGCFALATNNSGKIKVTVNGKNLIYPTNHTANASEWFFSQVSAYTTFMAYVPLKKGDVMVITANTVYGNFWGNIFGCA